MSEQGQPAEAPKPESTLIQQDGAIPETVIPAEPIPETAPEIPETPEVIPETPAEPEKPKRKPWYQDRIDTLTRQKNEEETAREAAEAKALALQPREDGEPIQGLRPEQIDQLVDQRADEKLARQKFETRAKSWIEAGNKEFGAADFQEKCAEVAAMGAGDSKDFMDLITDPEAIPDGHKVIAAMIEHPDEAQRILSLEPLKMAAALTRFATTTKPAEKAISKAPAPIKPIGGTAKNSAPSDNEPIGDWMAKRRAEVAAKGKH